MKIKIKATKIDLNEEIKDYVQKKMDMLDKYLGEIKVLNCDVEVALTVGGQQNGKIYKTEVSIQLPHELIYVAKTEKELFKSIDKVKDHLARSIKRYKEKMIDKSKKATKISQI